MEKCPIQAKISRLRGVVVKVDFKTIVVLRSVKKSNKEKRTCNVLVLGRVRVAGVGVGVSVVLKPLAERFIF